MRIPPIPNNHRASVTDCGTPIHLASEVSRRDFMRMLGAGTAGGALLGAAAPVLPQNFGDLEKALLLNAIDVAMASGADYADARIIHTRFEAVGTREYTITQVQNTDSLGINVRALVGGSWGFSATPNLNADAVAVTAREAVAIARANDQVAPGSLSLAEVDVYPDASWTTPHSIDPFTVSVDDKAALLLRANEEALRVRNVSYVTSSILSVKEQRLVATSDGSFVDQTLLRINPSMTITAISADGREFQTRGSVVEPAGRGFEYVLGLDLVGNAPIWADEAAQKQFAARVDPGVWDLVLHPSNLWLTIHESIGHPTELDRALGFEANYAGTSFLHPPESVLGRTRLGPEFMQFNGNRNEFGGCATTGWDDEAVPADSWPIIADGVFVDYQTTREQAAMIAPYTGNTRSHGCSYGQNWQSMPFQRMPNVSLLPGEEDLSDDDVIAATDRGIYVEGRGSYSIDQQRYNMQFAGQVFWEIRNGRKTRMLKELAYVGRTPEFWNSLSVIGGDSSYFLGASFGDAKGQPIQVNAVSHGCPTSLFRRVQIINTA